MSENSKFKPTLSKPINKQSKGLENNFKKISSQMNINLTEVDALLTEKEQSLKKKIFSLPKMESLVFSDPKLSAVYDEMAENGEEKYGYHYNETIQNMIFNDYVLNSPKYIQKYKMAIPKKKKRRDKSGINQLKRAGVEKMKRGGVINGKKDKDVSETTSSGSAGGFAGYVGYSSPHAWGNGDLMKGSKSNIVRKPIWKGGRIIQENENLMDGDMIETSEQLKNFLNTTNRKLKKEDIPRLKGQALYDVALKIANKIIGYITWDELADTNSLWDYIDENGGMIYDDLVSSIKNAVDERLSNEGFDGIFYESKKMKKNIRESNYLTKTSGFENYINKLEKENIGTMGEKIKIYIDNQPWFLERVDYTHFFMSDDKNKRGNLCKINQHRFKQYYYDIREWLWGAGNPNEKKYNSLQNEDATSMANISKMLSREDSMSNKMETSTLPIGTQQTGGMNESYIEQLNKELKAISKYHNTLSNMNEDRKLSTEVDRQRLINQNPSNFKKDLNHSGTKKIINIEKELEWKDQQTTIKNPQKLRADIEKQEIKSTDAKSDTHLKNVGDSVNDKGDEIIKRNRTEEEQNEVELYTKGLHSFKFDVEPSKRYKDRMKNDMGDKFHKIREKQLKDGEKQPLYNKESTPVYDGNEMNQYNKYKDINESMITGRYVDLLGKKRIIDFNIQTIKINENTDGLFKLDLTGFGNKYNSKTTNYKVTKNNKIVKLMEIYDFYTDGDNIYKTKKQKKNINESFDDNSENLKKMKHLLNYQPKKYIDTKGTKLNRGF